jgi:hypothetical protein
MKKRSLPLAKRPERPKENQELVEDLRGLKFRHEVLIRRHAAELERMNAIIASQRDWIVALEVRLRTALSEVAELRGEGDED